jgi:hypothetical protein
MRQTRPSLGIALALSISIAVFGNTSSEQARRVRLQELLASTSERVPMTLLDRAFLDVVAILNKPNECSQFFGIEATFVLNELVVRLKTRSSNNNSVAFRMSGPFVLYANIENGARYRLFETAEVNRDGPFYRSKVFPTDPFVPQIGSFPPNTRRARVLILLHELAHLIQANDGTWLIPYDGCDPELSRSNTLLVESKCKQQIRAI